MDLLLGALTILAIAVAICVIGFFAIRAVVSDRSHASSGTLGNAMLEVQSLEPQKKQIVEENREAEEAKDEDTIAGP